MDRWVGKVAVVTGASAGIGAAISVALTEHGMIVVGLARRDKRLQEMSTKLSGKNGKFYPFKADITNEEDILAAFAWIDKTLGQVHVLINNAGIASLLKPIAEGATESWRSVLETNVLGLTICIRETLMSMKAHNIDDGHIINISSMIAHISSPPYGCAMYAASKWAVQAITEGLRIELALSNSKIKTTTICPGVVQTELFAQTGVPVPPDLPSLHSENIAETVVFCLQTPRSVQVTDLHIKPLGKDFS